MDDLHMNGCFSARHVQRHEVDSLLSAVPYWVIGTPNRFNPALD